MGLRDRISRLRAANIAARNTTIMQRDVQLLASVSSWTQAVASRVPNQLVDPIMKRLMAHRLVGSGSDDIVEIHRTVLLDESVVSWRRASFPPGLDPMVYRHLSFGAGATMVLTRAYGSRALRPLLLLDLDVRYVLRDSAPFRWKTATQEEEEAKKAYLRLRHTLRYGLLDSCPKGARAYQAFLRDHAEHRAAAYARQYAEAPDPAA